MATKIILGCLGVYLCALLVSGVVLALDLNGARSQVAELRDSFVSGAYSSAQTSAESLAGSIHRANIVASSPFLAPLRVLPIVGSDMVTIGHLAASGDVLCSDVLLPTIDALASQNAEPLFGDDGAINAYSLQLVVNSVASNQDAVRKAADEAYSAPKAKVIGAVDSARAALCGACGPLSAIAKSGSDLGPRIPYLLGAEEGPRTYLFAALNNAEIKGSGGIPGSFAPLVIDNGKIDLGEALSLSAIPKYRDVISGAPYQGEGVPVSDEEVAVFGRRLGLAGSEATFTPDFPQAAYYLSSQYRDGGFGEVDGVIAVDVVLFSRMLAIAGGVSLSDGTYIDSENAAQFLLHDIYMSRPPEEQDVLFAEVANIASDSIFSSIGTNKTVDMAKVLWRGTKERRFLVWTADPSAESGLVAFGCSGSLLDGNEAQRLGVYYCDDTWAKMSWYLKAKTTIGRSETDANGVKSYAVTTQFINAISEEEAAGLSNYVAGRFRDSTKGAMLNWIYLFAPAGGSITDVKASGGVFSSPVSFNSDVYATLTHGGMNEGSYHGLDVWYGRALALPGEAVTVTYTVNMPAGSDAPLTLETTPLARPR